MSLAPDVRVGNYQILRPLGQGGMGEVYAARDLRLDREIALKLVSPEFAANPTWRLRFLREAKAAARLVHPNLAVIHEIGEWEGRMFMAMEYVKGESLQTRLAAGPMPFEEVRESAIQLAEVLRAAHQEGIVHRDIKPSNIMIAPDRGVKLMDFGLARFDLLQGPEDDSSLTAPGAILGTPAYLSPEQVTGKPADVRSDLFSLGIVLYEMAAGKHPFRGPNGMITAANILHQQPEPASSLNLQVSPSFDSVVSRCLAKNPVDRYQSAAGLLADLVQERSASSAPSAIPPSSPRRFWLLGAGAVSLGAAFYIWRQSTPRLHLESLAVLPVANVAANLS